MYVHVYIFALRYVHYLFANECASWSRKIFIFLCTASANVERLAFYRASRELLAYCSCAIIYVESVHLALDTVDRIIEMEFWSSWKFMSGKRLSRKFECCSSVADVDQIVVISQENKMSELRTHKIDYTKLCSPAWHSISSSFVVSWRTKFILSVLAAIQTKQWKF